MHWTTAVLILRRQRGIWVLEGSSSRVLWWKRRAGRSYMHFCVATLWSSLTTRWRICIEWCVPLWHLSHYFGSAKNNIQPIPLAHSQVKESGARGEKCMQLRMTCLVETFSSDDTVFMITQAYPRGGDSVALRALSPRDCQRLLSAILLSHD